MNKYEHIIQDAPLFLKEIKALSSLTYEWIGEF